MRMSEKKAFMAVLFAISAFVLVGKLIIPTPIQIVIEGKEPIVVGQIFSFTQIDVIIIATSALFLGISSFYLLFSDLIEAPKVLPITKKAPKLDVNFALRLLEGDKRKVFKEIVESGGEILQKDLVLQTGFPKAKITRILDDLERKGLIIRKRYGLTNKILIDRDMRIKTLRWWEKKKEEMNLRSPQKAR
jgi:uncharacterized membrane protein